MTLPTADKRPAPAQTLGLTSLSWPAPHHMTVLDPGAAARTEPCLVTMINGDKLKATVIRIDFEAGRLEITPAIGPAQVLPFAAFQSLCLTHAIKAEPIARPAPAGAAQAQPKNETPTCTITFKNGDVLETLVADTLSGKAGIFLFVANYGGTVLRWFLPAENVASSRLDGPPRQAQHSTNGLPQEALQATRTTPQDQPTHKVDRYQGEPDIVTRDALEAALQRQQGSSARKLGEILLGDGIITSEQLAQALDHQANDRRKLLGEILLEIGAVTPEAIRKVLVEQLGVPSVNLARFQYDPNAIKAISSELAHKYQVMPLFLSDKRIAIGIENPLSWEALHELEFFTKLKVDPAIATHEDLQAAIKQFYGGTSKEEQIANLVEKLGQEGTEGVVSVLQSVTDSDNTLVRMVNKMIVDAFDQGASDIHIESGAADKPSRVRFRVDGVMAPYTNVPPNFRSALVSRLKIMSELDISEHRRPQDGRIRFDDFGPRHIELRVIMMPTANGLEDVVMRLLAPPRALSIDQLSLSPRDLSALKAIAGRSYGLLFVCGPTGSGKTTTLHSLLSFINTPERKIWTVEDPIEITQEGLCQVQVNTKLDLTFPNVLRSFMRADPDVIMVGETRDPETARTVIAASLTGHLVFSTMHTNSAAESIIRLLDFGLDPFNFSDALLGVVGQRLVRRLCTACSTARVASSEEMDTLAHEYCRDTQTEPQEMVTRWRSRYGAADGSVMLHAPVGCPVCDDSGYKGRMGVYEVLIATPAIKAKIQSRATVAEVQQNAIDDGMITFEQDAIEKILQGFLDLKQVLLNCR
ncbi:MAG: GspE/PulE family protein [Hydrogenophaga sp.]|uniref:GspE/PulE family protein n=2 Tax=Hydrogenophaga TaxID=47420 RepID=UPI0027291C0B|nr:GspE/PulE family protein [Hydrogenophaga sp.]MDO9031263.1 GspE/PulE family protein [Hydrogenophaga sp.]